MHYAGYDARVLGTCNKHPRNMDVSRFTDNTKRDEIVRRMQRGFR